MDGLMPVDRSLSLLDVQRPRVNIVSACLIAGVSRATMYRWMRAGWIEFVRTPSGQVRIFADTLLRKAS